MNTYIKYIAIFLLSIFLLPSVSFADNYKQCLQFNNGLHLGSRDFVKNGDVSQLQDFLITQGFLHSNITGYYGNQTYRAIRDFQRTNGLSSVGNMGPMTREKIRHLTCNTQVTNSVVINSMTPTVGQIGTSVTLYGSNFTRENTINFGNGVVMNVPYTNSNMLTFTVPYSLTPACMYMNPRCMMEMTSILTPPGTYPVSVTNQNGQTSNSINFTVTSEQASARPVISGVDSPSILNTNQTGTWTVRATDPEGKGLSYGVLWGDEYMTYPSVMSSAQANNFVQTSTFTHSYANPGTYTVTFNVRGQNGQSVQSSVTVQVTNTTGNPYISSINPSEIYSFGSIVTIYGTGFTRKDNAISFNGVNNVAVHVPSYDGTSLQFTVPATPCDQDGRICARVILGYGSYPISVTNEKGTSNAVQIAIVPPKLFGQVTVSSHIGSVASVNQYLSLIPREIVEDSRCPIGVYCIQAGKFTVRTEVRSGDMIDFVNIGLNQPDVIVDGYKISITDVLPIKRAGVTINQSDYVITYQISKN